MSLEAGASLPLGIFELDGDGRILAYSTYGSSLLGRPKTEIIGKNFFNEVAGADGPKLEERFHHVYRDRIPFNKSQVGGEAETRQSVLMMFFPETRSVMVKVDRL